jgi:Domain of unknown function (DUF4249)
MKKILLGSVVLTTMHWQCVDKYNSPYKSPATGYLVVEGYISGNTPTQFTLSRTISLPGDSAIPMVTGARVQVEGSDNSVYPLAEDSPGVYSVDTLALNTAAQYRLRIATTDGQQYLSGYVQYTPTPLIDSINWVYNSTGVNIYANTHDPTGNIRYFQWNYTETWQYYSAEPSNIYYDDTNITVVERSLAEEIYTCWTTLNSTDILLGSSAKLSQATIYEQPIMYIPIGTQRLSVLYSILVRQHALTEDAYNFLSLMKQNTESLGSIFDAAPSQLVGNIQCLTNPNLPVVGYVSAGTVQQERIYISRVQVPNWDYVFSCGMADRSTPDIPDSLEGYLSSGLEVPIGLTGGRVYYNSAGCIDCRAQGGKTQEPSWWPN